MNKSLGYIRNSGVKVKLADGKMHELKYDMNALEYLEQAFGSIKNLAQVDLDSARNIKIFIHAGLLHEYEEGREPTLRETGKLVTLDMIMNFEEHIEEALILSFPEPEEPEAQEFKKK